jgi:hypothetical protein
MAETEIDQAPDGDETQTEPDPQNDNANSGRTQTAERSTIVFPYNPLKDAEAIAAAIHDNWGMETDPETLARRMDASHRSGAFRNKVSAARIFGVVEVGRGRITLTPLGTRIVDPSQRREARVEAFRNAPLFERLYEMHSGALLPQNQALENEIKQLGVLPKQAERARWAFQKSAEHAGFFAKEANRLIAPTGVGDNQGSAEQRAANAQNEVEPPPRGGVPSALPAALEQPLLAMLRDGDSWTAEQTHEYVDGLRKMHRALGH